MTMAQRRSTAQRTTASKTAGRSRASKENSGQLDGGRARDREVIEAAVEIFWEKGYANASVQDVADRLGMLKGSLYYYINSKESLLVKIFDDSHAEIKDITDVAVGSEGSALERLSRLALSVLQPEPAFAHRFLSGRRLNSAHRGCPPGTHVHLVGLHCTAGRVQR
jgi:AcrR family transcriptional regulator